MDALTPQIGVALVGCLVGSATDLRTGKIYNWTTLSMVALGLAMNATFGAVRLALVGLALSFIVHFALWKLGVQKGGDAKLMIGVGTLLGAPFMGEATLWYGVLYFPVGLLYLVLSGRLGNFIAMVRYELARATQQELPPRPEETMMRTGPVITAAVVAALLSPWLDFFSV